MDNGSLDFMKLKLVMFCLPVVKYVLIFSRLFLLVGKLLGDFKLQN